MEIKDIFVPYELAIIAKEKGFDASCFGYYLLNYPDKVGFPSNPDSCVNSSLEEKIMFTAPTHQQLIDWFRIEHKIWIDIVTDFYMGTDVYVPYIKGGFEKIELEVEGEYYEALNKAFERAFNVI